MNHHRLSPARRRIVVGFVAAASLAPATEAVATPCAKQSAHQVFADWGDTAHYYPAPDGGFEEGAAGWSLAGGATVVGGADPFALQGGPDAASLALRAGASATSPPFCIRRDARVVRWVQRAPRHAALRVDVVHLSDTATRPGRTLRVVGGRGSWQPGPKVGIPLAGTGLRGVGTAVVALKFTAVSGRWSIDDLMIDPRLKR